MRGARRTWIAAALGAIFILFTTAGCDTAASATDDSTTGTAESSDGVTLTYWAVAMGPSVTATEHILDERLAAFTDETGIAVDLDVMTWADAYNRVMTAVTSGRTPDLVDIGDTWSATLQATDAFLPFDQQAMTTVGGRDRFVDASMSATGAPGKPPASIPLYGQSYGMFYNTAMFDAAGIENPPDTWDEFIDDAQTLTKAGQWGVGILGGSAAANAHLAFILGRQHGARLFDDDGTPQFDSAAQRAAVRRLLDLMATQKVINPSDAEHSGLNDALSALAHGTVAMVPFQSAGRGFFASIGFTDYAVAPLPVVDPLPAGGAPVRSFVAGTNVAVFADTPHRRAALQLVKFLTSDSEQVALNDAFGTLPVVTTVQADPAFADPTTQMFATILRKHAETMPMVPEEGQMETLLGGVISDLWAKAATGPVTDEDIEAALSGATQQMTASG